MSKFDRNENASPTPLIRDHGEHRDTAVSDAFGGMLIERCETRLAFSVSPAAMAVVELMGLDSEAITLDASEPASTNESGDVGLLEQAESLRETHGLTGRGQTVAVIDSGIAWDHVSLGGGYGPGYRVVGGWDFAENDSVPYDDGPSGYHGTHIAGLIAGQSPELVGMAPDVDLVSLRVFDDHGAGQLEWIESALQWVHDSQADFESPITTVNLSVGAALNDANREAAMSLLNDELQMLRDDGILVFAAAGNFFGDQDLAPESDSLLFPASSPYVTPVTSIDADGTISGFAQRQDDILAADGRGVVSAVPDHVFGWDGSVDDYAQLDGTSMATPQVAAASVLIRQALLDAGQQPTGQDILDRIDAASQSHTDSVTGLTYRTIDLHAAVADLVQPPEQHEVFATNDAEQFILDLRDGMTLTMGEQTYRLGLGAGEDRIVLDAAGGADSLQIIGSSGPERLRLYPPVVDVGESRVISGGVEIALRGFEEVSFTGGGGNDRATLFDAPTDDQLQSHPNHATLSGVGFRFDVHDVQRTYVHATGGGNDAAYLHDSVGDDHLFVRPQYTSLIGQDAEGGETFQAAYGFESVHAYSQSGGIDAADLQDSAGDDVLTISANRVLVAGPDYQVSARGFDQVRAQAIAGGDDLVRLYADQDSNQWHTTDDLTQWTSTTGTTKLARGFERIEAFENFTRVELNPQSVLPAADDERQASRAVFERFGQWS